MTIVFAANVEYHPERAIRVTEGVAPKGIRPKTDGKPISKRIAMLEQHASNASDGGMQSMLMFSGEAARSCFVIHCNIAHGVSFKMETTLAFSRNPRLRGEVRKPEFDDLRREPSTSDMIRESVAALLRAVGTIAHDRKPHSEVASASSPRALRDVRSILAEFADHFYNPSFGKQ